MLDVLSYGAAGDGKTDDTKAFQDALLAAGEREETVLVPAGIYLVGELHVPQHVGLQGSATWSFRDSGGSILRLRDPEAACLLNLTGAYGATVTGLCLEGIRDQGKAHGILVDKPDYGTEEDTPLIDGCKISFFAGDGIRLERIWCYSVRHSQCYHNQGCGLRVRGWDGFILDNWFSGNGEAGYGAYDENAANTLTGNRIEWNQGCGIVICSGQNYNITGNYIDRSCGAGIALLSRDANQTPNMGITITGNVIYRSGKPDKRPLGEFESTQLLFENCCGLVCTGNSMTYGRDDRNLGEWSPKYGIIYKKLCDSIIKDNALHLGAMKELLLDQGGHGNNVIVADNVGSLAS